MAGVNGWSKNGIGKSRRSRSRASTPLRFFRCCKIHFAGFSENRPSRVLPTMTEMTVMLLTLSVTQSTDPRGRAAVTSSHLDYGLTEGLTRKHAVERCWQVLQSFCDVGLELHSSV